jgi:hypothetical protein
LARELHDRLDRLGSEIQIDAFVEVWTLGERIGALWQEAQGKPARRRMPSIEQAEKAAGVTPRMKEKADAARRQARQRGRKLPPR